MITLLAALTASAAPTCDVPPTYRLVDPPDFQEHRERVQGCAAWLLSRPLASEEEDQPAHSYVTRWVTGAPDITIRVRLEGLAGPVIKAAKDAGLSTTYVYGMLAAKLSRPESSPLEVELAGLQAMMDRYQARRTAGVAKKEKTLEAYRAWDPEVLRSKVEESLRP